MLRVKSWKFDDAQIFEHTLFGFSDLLHHRCQWIVWWVGNMINNEQTNEMENLSQSKITQTNRRGRMIRAVKKWKEKWPKSDFDFYENPLVVAECFSPLLWQDFRGKWCFLGEKLSLRCFGSFWSFSTISLSKGWRWIAFCLFWRNSMPFPFNITIMYWNQWNRA